MWTASAKRRRTRRRMTITASKAAPATPATQPHIPTDCSLTTVKTPSGHMSPCDPPTPPPPLSPAPWKQMGLKCHSRLRRLPQPLTLPHPHVRPDRSSPTQHNRREIQRDWGRARGSNRDSCGAEDSSDLLIRIWKTFVKEIVRWESK